MSALEFAMPPFDWEKLEGGDKTIGSTETAKYLMYGYLTRRRIRQSVFRRPVSLRGGREIIGCAMFRRIFNSMGTLRAVELAKPPLGSRKVRACRNCMAFQQPLN